ncbi:MAG: glycosyltransferase family 4 protein [Bacteroidota bacterium]
MAKKRIAIFGIKYFPSKGGTSRMVENLLLELKDQFDFTVYCYRHEQAEGHIPGVQTIQFAELPIKGIGVFWYYLRCCFHLMFSGQYDLIHAHKTDGAFFLPILGWKYKVIITSHALPYLNDKWSGLGKLYFRLAERIYMHSRQTRTAVSKTQTEYYTQTYQKPVSYIPNGIHKVKEVQAELADELLHQHQVEGDYLFFAARRLIPLKGCHTLLEALKLIQFKGTLLIAADAKQLPAYTEQLKRAARNLDVRFLGYVGDMAILNALIHRAQFFIFPSELEGMSMMLLEVGSLGTPMICSDIPQNKAVFDEREVLYFRSENAPDLAQKIQWAFRHPKEMQQRAQAAKKTIESEYLISHIVKQYTQLYQHLTQATD